MRVTNITCLILIYVLSIINATTSFSQRYKDNNYDLTIHQRIISRIERNFDSAFYHYPKNLDTTITVDQNALVQFVLKNGVIDSFYIWSVNDIKTSHWIKPFITPLIGKLIDTCKKYDYIICSVLVSDYETIKRSSDNMLGFTINLFNTLEQSSFKRTLAIGSAVLDCRWNSILKARKDLNQELPSKAVPLNKK